MQKMFTMRSVILDSAEKNGGTGIFFSEGGTFPKRYLDKNRAPDPLAGLGERGVAQVPK